MLNLRLEFLEHPGPHDSCDESVAEAVETVFGLQDRALLDWGGTTFALGMKYGIGVMIDDMMGLVSMLESAAEGEFRVEWPSSDFPYRWTLTWADGEVHIAATARDEPGAVTKPQYLTATVERDRLLGLLKPLLGSVLRCLHLSGYTTSQLRDLARLQFLVASNSQFSE